MDGGTRLADRRLLTLAAFLGGIGLIAVRRADPEGRQPAPAPDRGRVARRATAATTPTR